jgi:hypothetical protein
MKFNHLSVTEDPMFKEDLICHGKKYLLYLRNIREIKVEHCLHP